MMSPTASPILSRSDLMAIGRRVLELGQADATTVELVHTARGVDRISQSTVRSSNDGDNIRLEIRVTFGHRMSKPISLDRVDEASIRTALRIVEMMAREAYQDVLVGEIPTGPRSYLPVSLYHQNTVDAFTERRQAIVPELLTNLANARLLGSAFVGVMIRTTCIMDNSGLVATGEETDAEVALTAWQQDVPGTGWAGQAARDWNTIDVNTITSHAIELARAAANPVALEPGRRTAILGPAAVIQLMRFMASDFHGGLVFQNPPGSEKLDRIGERVCDARISILSDPQDPEGGYLPFFPVGTKGRPGFPIKERSVWVQDGILKGFAYSPDAFASLGRPGSAHPPPFSLRMTGGPVSVEEMISRCQDGVYVNRFSNVEYVDNRTGLLRGTTRDGCFYIKDGKIQKSIKNLRFAESPWFFLNRVEAMGPTHRAAWGYTPPGSFEGSGSWPRLPMIVPPLMVRDFNFTSLADAI